MMKRREVFTMVVGRKITTAEQVRNICKGDVFFDRNGFPHIADEDADVEDMDVDESRRSYFVVDTLDRVYGEADFPSKYSSIVL